MCLGGLSIIVLVALVVLNVNAEDRGWTERGYTVDSLSELVERVSRAQPGDMITLSDGIYAGEDCVLSGTGTAERPIVVRGERSGDVRIASPVMIQSDYVTIEDILSTFPPGSRTMDTRRCS